MTERNEWEQFFDGHSPVYMDNSFTKNTAQEVDFVIQVLGLPEHSHVLDIGCGTGRHAIELARRGYRVTGVDISSGMLAEAEKAAREAGVDVAWVHADASRFSSVDVFDAAICLCEGAFGLLGKDDGPLEHDLNILRNIYGVLKPGAGLISTVLNGCRWIRFHSQEDVASGRFNPVTMVETSAMEFETPAGRRNVLVRERSYVPTELVLLFRLAGLEVEHIGGGTAGNWGWRPLDLDEMEVMVIARKAASAV
jgi:SAM-dependent methyltransferase